MMIRTAATDAQANQLSCPETAGSPAGKKEIASVFVPRERQMRDSMQRRAGSQTVPVTHGDMRFHAQGLPCPQATVHRHPKETGPSPSPQPLQPPPREGERRRIPCRQRSKQYGAHCGIPLAQA